LHDLCSLRRGDGKCDAVREGFMTQIPFDLLREAATQNIADPIFVTISGAHLYGFPSPDSDFDLRGAHRANIDQILGLFPPHETLEPKVNASGLEVEIVSHEIEKYLRLLMKPNGYVLEQIYSPLVVLSTPAHQELKELAKGTICKGLYHHYRGFMFGLEQLIAKEKTKKIKRILYLYRVLMTGARVLETGEIEANILKLNERFKIETIPELIQLKQLELSALPEEKMLRCWDEIHELEALMMRAFETSTLPENPSGLDELSSWLVRLRKEQVRLS
jgi:predicted nucleotidyltransferase